MTSLLKVGSVFSDLTTEMDKVVIGYGDVKKISIAALFSGMHALLEGLPGTAKSLFVEVFQKAVRHSHSVRIQMTADVKPMDIVGVKVYNQGTGKFEIEYGPIVGKHFVLVDEINRAPGKTLSAVLSAMQELVVYIAGVPTILPDPFFVMATQNPIEQEGVYPLPEAAIDRFGVKIIVPYATAQDERTILKTEALDRRDPQSVVKEVIGVEDIVAIRDGLKKEVFVSDAAIEYIVALIRATRPGLDEHQLVVGKAGSTPHFADQIEVGSSVRGQLALRGMARVYAALAGRAYVTPDDIQEVALPVMRHRVAQTFEAAADDHTSDEAVKTILEHTPFSTKKDQYTPPVSK